MLKDKIDAYIEQQRENMLRDLCALVRIDSQRGESAPGKPFGEGPAKVLEKAQEILADSSMTVTNYDNYVVTGDFGPAERQLDILAHLDVVPVTDRWTVTQPFEPLIKGNAIYGRGTCDDKGPAIAAIYAVRAIRDLQVPLKKGVRIILGSDEECGSSDLEYYYAKEAEAPCSFTPDADFPLINLEKARLAQPFEATVCEDGPLPRLLSLECGDKVNVVPAFATALVAGLGLEEAKQALASLEEKLGGQLELSEEEGGLRVSYTGLAAHAAYPEGGNSASTAILALLSALPLADTDSTRMICGLAKLFPHGDCKGTALGVAMKEEHSGELTLNLGILKFCEGKFWGQFDIRAPLCATDENLTKVIGAALAGAGFTMEEGALTPAHYVPEDTPFVQTLLSVYEAYSGIKGKPLYTGGGTYVHHLENGVAFGCMNEGVDNHMHGDDEFMEISTLLMSAKIFALAIARICGEEA